MAGNLSKWNICELEMLLISQYNQNFSEQHAEKQGMS